MITDKIENLFLYNGMNQRMNQIANYLKTTDLSKITPGKYPIDGADIYLSVNQYETKNEMDCKLEAHKKYIDLQYMVSGCERIGYIPLSDQTIMQEYDDDKDYTFYMPENLSFFNLFAGSFAIFFPEDLHMPGIICNKSENVKKLVFKILY